RERRGNTRSSRSNSAIWIGQGRLCGAHAEPRCDDGRQLREVRDRRVRLDLDIRLRMVGPSPDRAQTQALRAEDVGIEAVTHHERLLRSRACDLERAVVDRAVRLLPPDAVR